MRTFVAPYKMGSKSAKTLANSLLVKRVDGTKIFKPTDKIINWGKSTLAPRGNPTILNKPEAIRNAANKLRTFTLLKQAGVSTVDWTTDSEIAKIWLTQNEVVVYGRKLLDAHSGKGIVLMGEGKENFTYCPLYTKGILKAHEYRLHVFKGQVIDVQKKRRRNENQANDFIKNLANGWVFCRDEVRPPMEVYNQSVKAIAALGLDFGAVDILYKQSENKIAILEINTSPGMEGTTVEAYTKAIKRCLCLR